MASGKSESSSEGPEDEEGSKREPDGTENSVNLSELTDPQIFSFIDRCAEDIATARNKPVLYLLYPQNGHIGPLDAMEVYHTFLLDTDIEDLDIILHSLGGDIHEAYDIIRLCRKHTMGEVTVFVPIRAMSAATLIALGADKVVLSDIGKLGPLDPQVPHPQNNEFIPVRAVTDLTTVLEKSLVPQETDLDPEVKGESIIKPIAKQVDPYHLTLHERTADLAKEYGKKVLAERGLSEAKADRCIKYLIEYPAHSFSVDLREIRESRSLGEVIDVMGVDDLDRGDQIEWALISLINFYVFWDLRYLKQEDPRIETHIDLIFPKEPEQQRLDEVDADQLEELPEDLREEIENAQLEELPEDLKEVVDELDEDEANNEGGSDDEPNEANNG